ncbi:MAG: T9SS type A sorting domain-containing protein [Bacteroidia bacterium]
MKKVYIFIIIASFSVNTKAQVPITLLSNLQYPTGLWIKGDNVFFTETRGRNTIFGGNISLDRYRISSGQKTIIVNQPENSDAVVVASDGMIYLTSYQNFIPGEYGKVSVVDTTTLIETHLLDIAIASRDMFIDGNDNISIIGMSDLANANSIYYLASGNYTNPTVLQTGLGRTWCISKKNDTTYFSDLYSTFYFGSNGIINTFMNKFIISISFSPNYLFYADYIAGTIGKINMQTMVDQTILTGLHEVLNVRYDAGSNDLYFVEGGTVTAQFTDGTLKVLHNADNILTTVNFLEDADDQIQIYPNPFHNKAVLKFSVAGIVISELKIYDLMGNEVAKYEIKNPHTEISSGNLSSGVYFYQLQGKNEIIGSGKIIIQ